MVKLENNLKSRKTKYITYIEKRFSELFPTIIFTALWFSGCLKKETTFNIDYAGYAINVVSIMLGFYLSNIFIISNAHESSIIGKLHPNTQKRLFNYNSISIFYSIAIIVCYLGLRFSNHFFYLFIFLLLCNLFSGIRIYGLMFKSAKKELDKKIKQHKEYF